MTDPCLCRKAGILQALERGFCRVTLPFSFRHRGITSPAGSPFGTPGTGYPSVTWDAEFHHPTWQPINRNRQLLPSGWPRLWHCLGSNSNDDSSCLWHDSNPKHLTGTSSCTGEAEGEEGRWWTTYLGRACVLSCQGGASRSVPNDVCCFGMLWVSLYRSMSLAGFSQ